MTCVNCGAALKEGAGFCIQCGFRVTSTNPPPLAAVPVPPDPPDPPPLPPLPVAAVPEAPAPKIPSAFLTTPQPIQVSGEGYKISDGPAFSVLTIYLPSEQSMIAESGAMVAMSANIELQSEMKGGLMGALKRKLAGESIFQTTFTARGGVPGEVLLAPPCPGDIAALQLSGNTYLVQSSSFLASDITLQMDTKFAGAKGFFAREGLFMIQISGTGRLFISSFGAIVKKTLAPGERYIVDTGHIVAFENTVNYALRKASQQGWIRSALSGEGVVAEYVGPGTLYLQTRNISAFAGWIMPFFPNQGKSGGGGFSINLGG
jgi:uncharacterized protein (TIGR00266 family)